MNNGNGTLCCTVITGMCVVYVANVARYWLPLGINSLNNRYGESIFFLPTWNVF